MISINTSELQTSMSVKISWMDKIGTPLENIRRIKLIYYVNDEPYGLVIKSMFTTSQYSINKHNVVISTRDTNECALICLMNDQCEYFEFRKKLNNNGICMLAYSLLEASKSICQSDCYEIRKGKYLMMMLRFLLIENYKI